MINEGNDDQNDAPQDIQDEYLDNDNNDNYDNENEVDTYSLELLNSALILCTFQKCTKLRMINKKIKINSGILH